jgi:UDP-3-O-[3-hydroxymyristoyl] glucosamine N-acyltransferase
LGGNLKITTGEISKRLSAEIRGNSDLLIFGIKPLSSATASDLSFFSPTAKRKTVELTKQAKESAAGALLVSEFDDGFKCTQIKVPHPLGALVELAPFFKVSDQEGGVHPTAVVHETATISPTASIGAFVVIGARSKIGDRTIIYPHSCIYHDVAIGSDGVIHAGSIIREGTQIGQNCLLQPGAVVGGDGFGYLPDKKIGHRRIPHLGQVILENDVDLGANTTIDRGTFGETRIGNGTKIDNLVMVGHNVKIGERSLLCAQVGISGSCEIGDEVVLAGQAGIADHVKIGNRVRVGAKSGVSSDVEKGDVAGYPHQEASKWRRNQIAIKYLPELLKKRGL